jgi:hypothetical protein
MRLKKSIVDYTVCFGWHGVTNDLSYIKNATENAECNRPLKNAWYTHIYSLVFYNTQTQLKFIWNVFAFSRMQKMWIFAMPY